MKPLLTVLAFFICIHTLLGQTPSHKTKILLLGVPHFTPSPTDVYKSKGFDVESTKGQKQIAEVVTKLAAFKPNQICVEREVNYQPKLDSAYKLYLTGKYKLGVSEIDQLGFQTAKKLGLTSLTAVNYMGYFETAPLEEFATKNNQTHLLDSLYQFAQANNDENKDKQQNLPLKEFLLFDNSPYALSNNHQLYTKYTVKIGKEDQYVGTNLVAEWYKTNLHIYTNILRKLQPADRAILVIYGQGHIPILRHLFESNPNFELVEVKDVLN
ncbi:DUF5694 domain-containing protein [Rhodocytophaga aerolata]|uniref:DUF5694 domain-containing protein n=1 Tax=Rhodocytophaga aerolata TaxID=455078 RepID=A0ABT8RGG6_9BACT|nr:DUF5694 domain-containing protein [Rhodocytophaga aerolata]MDO1450238.1 DUF5694 domain-containing protein [Rhodocytophaga aerolata]